MRRTNSIGTIAVLLCILSLSVAGCQQLTRAPQVADTQQETAAQGSQVNFWFINGSDAAAAQSKIIPVESLADALAKAEGADGQKTDAASGGYVFAGRDIYMTVNTGSTTPSQAASSTGTQTVSPNQEPKASTAADIAAGQTVNADQGATAGQGTGTVTSEKQSQTEQRFARLEGDMAKMKELLAEWLALQGTPTTQPSEAP